MGPQVLPFLTFRKPKECTTMYVSLMPAFIHWTVILVLYNTTTWHYLKKSFVFFIYLLILSVSLWNEKKKKKKKKSVCSVLLPVCLWVALQLNHWSYRSAVWSEHPAALQFDNISDEFQADKLGKILWAYAFPYLPRRLLCPINSHLSKPLLSIFNQYPENWCLRNASQEFILHTSLCGR